MMSSERTMLLVEDNDDDIELARLAIDRAGVPVQLDVVRNGAEALDYLFARGAHANRSGRPLPRVVLLDLNLPLLDGREVLKALREDPRTAAIPVVMMTTSIEPPDLYSVHRLHVNSYVQKPMEFERFVRTIEQIAVYWLDINRGSFR